MRISLMKWIDRNIGVVICFILSLFVSKPKQSKPKKILLLKPAEMGTSVILLPVISYLKEEYKDSELFFLVFEENVEILKVLQMIPEKNLLTIRTENIFLFLLDNLKAILRLRKEKIDIALDFEFFARYTAVFAFLSGANIRVGLGRFKSEGLYRGRLHTHRVPYNPYSHIGEVFLSIALAAKEPPGDVILTQPITIKREIPKFTPKEEVKQRFIEKIKKEYPHLEGKKIVLIAPRTGRWLLYREWPLEYFASLTQLLLQHNEVLVVMTGKGREAEESSLWLTQRIKNERLINLCSKTTLEELLTLYTISNLLVSVDSAPPHFATLTDIKIISIFGPESEKVFAPLSENSLCLWADIYCHPCFSVYNHREPPCKDEIKECLLLIKPEYVYEKCVKLLYST